MPQIVFSDDIYKSFNILKVLPSLTNSVVLNSNYAKELVNDVFTKIKSCRHLYAVTFFASTTFKDIERLSNQEKKCLNGKCLFIMNWLASITYKDNQ
jgi:hypothetical protein